MKTVVTAAILIVTSTAFAESLEERKYWKRQRDYVEEHLKGVERACGFKPNFEFHDQPTLRSETEKTRHSPMGVCNTLVDEIASICREGKDEASSVKAKISTIQCGFAADRSLDLKSNTLRYLGNNTQANFSNWARPWLLKHL